MQAATSDGPLRYVLAVVAVGASLFLAWIAWLSQADPPNEPGDINFTGGVIAAAAIAMAAAARALIARRAWGAYVLSVAAFLASLPLAFVALALGTYDTTNQPHPERFLWVCAVGLAIAVGVAALRLGRAIRRENKGPAD
jgi:drug/metabolite transporter (DMT)-like permease